MRQCHGQPRSLLWVGILLLNCAMGGYGWAGGSGLNTVVVANQGSPDSCELANYFCERREVPPENVLRIYWSGGNTSWSSSEFQANLLSPLLDMLASRQLTNQIDYVVLSMDIPFQTTNSNGVTVNSTTSALFYGLKPDGGISWKGVTNSYAASEAIFRQAKPASAPGYSFLATMITANSLAQAKALVDQGVAGDGTFPYQPVILAKSSDPLRNIRHLAFDNAIFNAELCGKSSILSTNSESPWGQTNLLGYQTGLANFSVSPGAFIPGAMADSLTSFGGIIFGPNDQTSLLAFIHAGAAGSYGTVTEPYADAQKFPDPQVYFYQSRGFSLAECYYQSINAPYLGLIVGEPLAAPYRHLGSGKWLGTNFNAVLSGTSELSLRFSARDEHHPLQQVDLFVDGKYFRTLTNVAPCPGNLLIVALNGYSITYTVPTNATLRTVATGLAALINAPSTTNATKVMAFARGDRIELHSVSTNRLADSFYFTDRAATNSPGRSYRIRYVPDSFPPQLSLLGGDRGGTFRVQVEALPKPYVIEASTNLTDWRSIFTNLLGGPLDFVDLAARDYSRRFYRIVSSGSEGGPRLSPLPGSSGAGFKLLVETEAAVPYTIEASTNLSDWSSILTNLLSGTRDFVDSQATNFPHRFYRASVLPQELAPGFTVLNGPTNGGALIRVDGAVWPYTIEASADLDQWTPIFTNLAVGRVHTAVSSAIGSGDAFTTFLTASRGYFLRSEARGLGRFSVSGSPQIGSWLQLSVTKTNGASVSVAVTNQLAGATVLDLTRQLVDLLNSTPDLQGDDGVIAEDLTADSFGAAIFNLRARSPGYEAAAVRVLLTRSGNLSSTPAAQVTLSQNLSDLQPRNHLYLTAGAAAHTLTFPLDTTTLADGFHELTAVAYEGSHVRTQTRCTLPVRIQNTPLSASLTVLDAGATAPVNEVFHIEVAANTNEVSNISLFSTGGLLGAVTNQPTATFPVNGLTLGIGLHPFYAVVTTDGGLAYRTETQTIRLVAP